MNRKYRKIAVFVGTATLAAGAGVGVAATGGDSSADEDASRPGMTQPGGAGPRGGFDLSALAEELGVSESRLREALHAARPEPGSGPADMAATLAAELGISAADVRAALEATRPGGGPPSAPPATGSDQSAC